MDAVQKLEAQRAEAARDYRAMVEDEALDWKLPETLEKEGNLKAAITGFDARIKALKDSEDIVGEAIFKEAADQEGISLDQKMSKADAAMVAVHDLMKAKTLGKPMPEASAKIMGVHPETLRKVAVDTAADARGGFSVPTEVAAMVTERELYYNSWRREGMADVETSMTGRDTVHVTEDDTANIGEVIAAGDVDADAPAFKATGQGRAFKAVTIKHDLYSSKRMRLSKQYIQDTATSSVVGGMARTAATRLGRALAKALARGDSASGVAGVSNLGYLETPNPQVSNHVFAPIGSNDAKTKDGITLEHFARAFTTALDPSYWQGSALFVSADTLGVIWTLKDANGRPAYIPSLNSTEPGSLLGRRLFVEQELDNIGTSKVIGLYCQPSLLKISDVANSMEYIVVDMDELNVQSYMTSHFMFRRCGFGVVTAGDGFATITTAA